MLKTGILNPAINSPLMRVRHINALVIADRGFSFWPQLETVDLSLVDDLPQALEKISACFEPQLKFKKRVSDAIGLIRTGDTTQYANVILESA